MMVCTFVAAAAFTILLVVLSWSRNDVPYTIKMIMPLTSTTVEQLIAVTEFYNGALDALFHTRVIGMNMLVVIRLCLCVDSRSTNWNNIPSLTAL